MNVKKKPATIYKSSFNKILDFIEDILILNCSAHLVSLCRRTSTFIEVEMTVKVIGDFKCQINELFYENSNILKYLRNINMRSLHALFYGCC